MTISKEKIYSKVEYNFMFFFPVMIVLFSPSKYILGIVSLPDIFLGVHFLLFLIYSSLKKKVVINNYVVLLFFLIVFSFVGLLVNDKLYFLSKIKYQIRFIYYFLAFLITTNYLNKQSINYFISGLFFATKFVCIYGIIQTVFLEKMIHTIFWIDDFPDYILLTFRTVSTFSNPLNLCAFLSFPLGVLHFKKGKWSNSEIYLLILIYLTLLLTASKVAMILICMSILVFFKKYWKFFLIFFAITLTAIVIVFTSKTIQEKLKSNFIIYDRITNERLIEGSINQRIYVINSSVKMIKDNPIFGIGYENFGKNYLKGYKHENAVKTEDSYTAENFFLDFYLDNGFVPFLIIILFFVQTFFIHLNKRSFSIKFTYSIFFYSICGLVMSARTVPLMYTLFIFFAIIFRLTNIYPLKK